MVRTDKAESERIVLCRCSVTTGNATFGVEGSDVVMFDEFVRVADAAEWTATGAGVQVLGTATLTLNDSVNRFFLARWTTAPVGASSLRAVRSWDDRVPAAEKSGP